MGISLSDIQKRTLECLLTCSLADEGRLLFWSPVVLEKAILMSKDHARRGQRESRVEQRMEHSKADEMECRTRS